MRLPRLRVAATAVLAVCAASVVDGFWRMPCKNPLVIERADPLTNPGSISGHVHTISGGSNFNLDMTFGDARGGSCTSCQIKQDMSNYWVPALYFAWANGSFTLVDQGGLLVYYMQRTHADDKNPIRAFPEGFRTLVGNPYTRSYDPSDRMSQNITINCINGKDVAYTPGFPTRNCETSLRVEILFPSCWDGENADSTNSKSHVAYPEGGEYGPCPETHPERLITLFYELWWTTDPWKDKWEDAANTSQPFVFSMGDPTGYGSHADFLNGWDTEVLQKAIDGCTSDTGIIEECKIFDLYDYDDMDATCFQSSAVDELVDGTLADLPGCNPVDSGPGDITVCSEENPPSLNSQITLSGGLAAGQTIKVATSSSGGSSGGGDAGTGGDGGSSSKASAAGDAKSSRGAAAPSASGSSHASSGASSLSSGGSSSSGGSEHAASPSSSSSSEEGNGKLWIGLFIGGVAFLCVGICLSCRFQCRRRRKRLDQQIPPVDEESRAEKRGLRSDTSTSSSDSSSDEDDPPARRRG